MARDVRCEHFRVFGRFDGAGAATVSIEYHDAHRAFFRVRPLRRHRAFEVSLADLARGVVFDVVKAELKARKAARKRSR